MSNTEHRPYRGVDEDTALRIIMEGTATETGESFFKALVENLAKVLDTKGAWVTYDCMCETIGQELPEPPGDGPPTVPN